MHSCSQWNGPPELGHYQASTSRGLPADRNKTRRIWTSWHLWRVYCWQRETPHLQIIWPPSILPPRNYPLWPCRSDGSSLNWWKLIFCHFRRWSHMPHLGHVHEVERSDPRDLQKFHCDDLETYWPQHQGFPLWSWRRIHVCRFFEISRGLWDHAWDVSAENATHWGQTPIYPGG